MERMAKEFEHWLSREAENNSKGWPKFDGKILSYPVWKKAWERHHEDVYPNLTVDHLKRVLVEQCLPEEVKDRITYKPTMEEVWRFLDIKYMRTNQYLVDLMKPVQSARELAQGDFRGLERHLGMLEHTFDQAKGADMLDSLLHPITVQQMYEKWPPDERVRWWRIAGKIPLLEQPQRFVEYVRQQYPLAARMADQDAVSRSSADRRECGEGEQDPKKKRKQPKVMINAAQAAALTAPTQPQLQRQGKQPGPCRMADPGCTSSHLLDKCEVFKNSSAESRLAKLQGWRLCLCCFKHWADQECYSGNDKEYQG